MNYAIEKIKEILTEQRIIRLHAFYDKREQIKKIKMVHKFNKKEIVNILKILYLEKLDEDIYIIVNCLYAEELHIKNNHINQNSINKINEMGYLFYFSGNNEFVIICKN